MRLPTGSLAIVPLKDAVVGMAWLAGFLTDRIEWRGNRLRVLPGTRLEEVPAGVVRPHTA